MSTQAEAFPLQWPAGWSRTSSRENSRFETTFGRVRDELVNELRLMGASMPVISTNLPLRRDGLPRADSGYISDPGVACYFLYKGKPMVFACDRWKRVEDNLQAVKKTIEAIRGIKRWGVSDMLERAFTGFQALPAPTKEIGWREVLGFTANSRPSPEAVKNSYRNLANQFHPDKGGSHEKMLAINNAYSQGMQEVG